MPANNYLILSAAFVAGLFLGLLLMWLIARARLQEEKVQLHEQIATLKASHQADAEKLTWLDKAQESMREAFQALASQSLRSNSEDFLKAHREQLQNLVQPLDKALQDMSQNVRALEGKREGAYGELKENLGQLFKLSQQLQMETSKLSHALKSGAQQRGRWAEFQLQRLAELAGMKERVDFHLQEDVGEGRPDMVVWLPRGGCIVVDAKAPMKHYFEALESSSEESRKKNLEEHARRVKQHLDSLHSKDYTRHLPEGSQFVVMYLPSDACLIAALDSDHRLLEHAFEKHIILATPTTLFALLKTVATGWQQYLIDENAKLILTHGQELSHRLKTFIDHFAGIGKGLKHAVDKFNEAVGSYKERLRPEADRFQELRGVTETLPEVSTVDTQPRQLQPPEPPDEPTPD
jgi:DNA recombination protein RmuC